MCRRNGLVLGMETSSKGLVHVCTPLPAELARGDGICSSATQLPHLWHAALCTLCMYVLMPVKWINLSLVSLHTSTGGCSLLLCVGATMYYT